MDQWKDIYELSDNIVKRILEEGENQEDHPSGEAENLEKIYRKLSQPIELEQRIKKQEKYNSRQAYRHFVWQRRKKNLRWTGVAAVMILLVGLSGLWLYRWQPVNTTSVTQTIEPGYKKAVLTLANGSVWNIDDTTRQIGTNGENLKIDSTGLQVIADNSDKSNEAPSYNTLSVPRGGEFALTLPDGTRVWLNSETSLRFPTHFAADQRKVYLQGEAYFDVTHDQKRPFRVETEEGNINVLGTEFCVSVYQGENLSATLVKGSIQFKSPSGTETLLHPSQRLTYDVKDGKISVEKVNTWTYTSWKDQIFCFEGQNLQEILNILSRWYDVDIRFESEELKQVKLSGTLDKYEDIGPFLKLFEAGTDVQFDIQQKKIIVKKKK